MKFLVVFLAVFAVVCANDDEWKPKTLGEVTAIQAECNEESGLTDDQNLRMASFDLPDEAEVRKYFLCYSTKMGLFSPGKGYNTERVGAHLKLKMDEAEKMEIIKSCAGKNEEGSPDDVWAFRFHSCLSTSKVGQKIKDDFKQLQDAIKRFNEYFHATTYDR